MGAEERGGTGRPPGTRRVDDNGWIIDDAEAEGSSVGWRDILVHWPLIEADFEREYRVDLSDQELCRSRSARWFLSRLFGLSERARLWAALRPDPQQDDSTDDIDKALGLARQ